MSAPDGFPASPTILGRDIGRLGWGCWRLTTGSTVEATRLVEGVLDLGCHLVDTADVYGLDWGGSGWGSCEERLGAVIAARPGLRERMVLTTKGGIAPGVPYDSSAAYLTAACEASLRRLGVDHVDLYMVHRPDMLAHPGDVARTLLALRDRGLIRAIGVSNHTPAQVAALEHHLGEPLTAIQPEFSVGALAALRDGTLDQAMQSGTTVLAWSPLAGGRLASGDGVRPELVAILDRVAEERSVSRSVVALAFVLAHPSAPVALLGTQRLDRIAEAMAAINLALTRAEFYALVEAAEGTPLP